MKKINISLVLMALLFMGALTTQTSFARKTSVEKTPDMKQLNKAINKLVTYPDFTLSDMEEDGEVYVTFMLTDEGIIKDEKVTAPSKRMEEYVKEKISQVKVNDLIHPRNQKYKVKIRFDKS